jgi:hypothetical protein
MTVVGTYRDENALTLTMVAEFDARLPPCRSWKPNRLHVRPVRARKELNIHASADEAA